MKRDGNFERKIKMNLDNHVWYNEQYGESCKGHFWFHTVERYQYFDLHFWDHSFFPFRDMHYENFIQLP